jgi:hypothetical protein
VREVLAARSGRDFTSVSAPRHRRARARPSIARLVLAFIVRRPGRLAGGLLFAATAAFISINALTMQSTPHPAPLFGKAERDAVARQNAPVAQRVPTQPAVPRTIEDIIPPLPPSRRPGETASTSSDPIADLLRSGTNPSPAAPVATAPEPDFRIMSAQRALVKLGYGPLTDDGLFGPMTRSAIERFEREQGLEVTGTLGPQTARVLSVRSGIVID